MTSMYNSPFIIVASSVLLVSVVIWPAIGWTLHPIGSELIVGRIPTDYRPDPDRLPVKFRPVANRILASCRSNPGQLSVGLWSASTKNLLASAARLTVLLSQNSADAGHNPVGIHMRSFPDRFSVGFRSTPTEFWLASTADWRRWQVNFPQASATIRTTIGRQPIEEWLDFASSRR